jgi:Ser/Thr protein kinase RdoA (MazF antagonist)
LDFVRWKFWVVRGNRGWPERRILGEVLSNEVVAEHLMRHYGIDGGISRIPQGRADNYRVVCRGEHFLLKVFQPEYDFPAVERAAAFLQFVARAGYPAKEFVGSLSGSGVVPCGNRASVLLPWIDGNTPEPNSVSKESMLAQVGGPAGRMCLRRIPVSTHNEHLWLAHPAAWWPARLRKVAHRSCPVPRREQGRPT